MDENGTRVFNSEINRTRVHFFPETTSLVYSFWKYEKVAQNGRLFLHVYPRNISELRPERRNFGFENLSIKVGDLRTADSTNFYMIKKLELHFSIKTIVTGQYTEKGKVWKAQFDPDAPGGGLASSHPLAPSQQLNCSPESHPVNSIPFLLITRALPLVTRPTTDYLNVYSGKEKNYLIICDQGTEGIQVHLACTLTYQKPKPGQKIFEAVTQDCSETGCLAVFRIDKEAGNCVIRNGLNKNTD